MNTVSIQNLSHRYGKTLALDDVSLDIPKGATVGLIGPDGVGKSTLLSLMAGVKVIQDGLYLPREGSVKLDGIEIQQIEPADVRRHVLYVGQDTRLFFGTLRENLKAGNPHIDDDSMMRIADAFGVHQMASRHPRGYDMPIGEGGNGLSGGQRQAVALARAVIANPAVMLLDEPTSAMDTATETMVMQALSRLSTRQTMVFVTHKLQLLDFVNRVMIMDGGVRVADGPKEAVLQALKEGKIQGVRRV